jgi:hypothetical protein
VPKSIKTIFRHIFSALLQTCPMPAINKICQVVALELQKMCFVGTFKKGQFGVDAGNGIALANYYFSLFYT